MEETIIPLILNIW